MRLLEPTAQIWMTIDPYYQRQKCMPMNLVSENIRFMQIFAGVPLGAGVENDIGDCRRRPFFGDLGGYIFENFRDTASNNNVTICSPLSTGKWLQSEWPWAAISWQNAFLASTSWIRAFECQKITQPLRFCGVLCIAYQLASLVRQALLTRCFSAVGELLVLAVCNVLVCVVMLNSVSLTSSNFSCVDSCQAFSLSLLFKRGHYQV